MLEPLAVVGALLGEPAIVGTLVGEVELERGVDGEVGLADLGAVRLAVDRDLLAEIAERESAGVARRLLKELVILLERRGLWAVVLSVQSRSLALGKTL